MFSESIIGGYKSNNGRIGYPIKKLFKAVDPDFSQNENTIYGGGADNYSRFDDFGMPPILTYESCPCEKKHKCEDKGVIPDNIFDALFGFVSIGNSPLNKAKSIKNIKTSIRKTKKV